MEQPPIQLFGVTILEPVTSLTAILVALMCFFAWHKLKQSDRQDAVHKYLKYYFLTMGIATFLGGLIGHAFLYLLSFSWKLPGWVISMFSISLIERACINEAQPLLKPRMVRFLKIANITELLTFISIVFYTLDFNFVGVHSAYGLMVVVFPLQLLVYLKTKHAGSRWMLLAVGLALVAYVVYLSRFSFHPYFNYFDISHVLMMLCVFLFYRGALELEKGEGKPLSVAQH